MGTNILCTICMALAIYILIEITRIYIAVKTVLVVVAAAYFLITLIDIVSATLLKPFVWNSWILFTLMGALGFFLCVGFIMFRLKPLGLGLYISAMAANVVTGAVFLFDLLYIISWLVNRETIVKPAKEPITCAIPKTIIDENEENDKAIQCPGDDLQVTTTDKSVQCTGDTLHRKGKFTSCTQDTCTKKYAAPQVPTHGGTFHVSKDVAPVLSPTRIRYTRGCGTFESNDSRSVRSCLEYNNEITCQKNNYEKAASIQSAPAKTCRMTSAALQTQTGKYQEQYGTTNAAVGCGRPHSSPVQNQTQTYPATVQHYYKCHRCGGTHQQVATVQPIVPSNESYNACRWQKLPTVPETYYSSTGSGMDNSICCPCPSPQTPSSSNQPSPSTDYSPRSLKKQCFYDGDMANMYMYKMEENEFVNRGIAPEVTYCKAEQDTMLPGAADRSPRSVDRYIAIPAQPQKPTIINIDDDLSNASIRYLVPTICHPVQDSNESRHQRSSRNQGKCTLL